MKIEVRSSAYAALLSAFLVSMTSTVILAQGSIPDRVDQFVNEFTEVLSAEDEVSIRATLSDLQQKTGIEAVVVTINSFDDYDSGALTIEAFATSLFNSWGIGDSVRNDGVLILLAVTDRGVRIELGSGYDSTYDTSMKRIIDGVMIPAFKLDDYSSGLSTGTRAVADAVSAQVGESNPASRPGLSDRPPSSPVGGARTRPSSAGGAQTQQAKPAKRWPVWGAVLAMLSAGAAGLRRYLRYRRRRCAHCGSQMERLDESADDKFLESGQQIEEALESVDYDVWRCPSCNRHTLRGYRSWMSSYKKCPGCTHRTLSVDARTIREPTYGYEGEEEITRQCRHCDYSDQRIVILPMLKRSDDGDSDSSNFFGGGSSDGNSSFGGGRSSGGGASGKW